MDSVGLEEFDFVVELLHLFRVLVGFVLGTDALFHKFLQFGDDSFLAFDRLRVEIFFGRFGLECLDFCDLHFVLTMYILYFLQNLISPFNLLECAIQFMLKLHIPVHLTLVSHSH